MAVELAQCRVRVRAAECLYEDLGSAAVFVAIVRQQVLHATRMEHNGVANGRVRLYSYVPDEVWQ